MVKDKKITVEELQRAIRKGYFDELLTNMTKDENKEYFIRGMTIDNRMFEEHEKGHRPSQHIEAEYFEKIDLQKLKVSQRFFK